MKFLYKILMIFQNTLLISCFDFLLGGFTIIILKLQIRFMERIRDKYKDLL